MHALRWIEPGGQEPHDDGRFAAGAVNGYQCCTSECLGDQLAGRTTSRSTKGAVESRTGDVKMRGRMTALAGFFAETTLAEAPGRVPGITSGGAAMLDQSEALFGSL